MYLNTNGSFNTAIGENALNNNVSGTSNTATGFFSLLNNTTGTGNTGTGNNALYSNITGSNNTAIGDQAGYSNLGSSNVFIGKNVGYYETSNNKLYIGSDSNRTIVYGDMVTGQVLLGKKQPFGYTFKGTRTLNVIGGILTDSIWVAPSNTWSDYVFSDNYNLRPLSEVEQFIKANQHLPNIPSATEVSKNGFNMVEMNAKLLEKVEELTLYLLQQQKQLDQQQKINETQQQQIDELKKLVQKIR
jgi:hypothetical protein